MMFNKNSGNILFLILIAVALFATLSYAVTTGQRTPGQTVDKERAKISQAEIDSYTAQLNQGKTRLQLINNCSVIDYTPPENQAAGDKTCHMFHPDGAGVAYRNFSDTCPDDDLLAGLSVGEACGTLIYAGLSGGDRIYTLAADQGTLSWNNGSNAFADRHNTGATSTNDGMFNTNTLLARVDSAVPYIAANTCRSLGAEWYLPSQDELTTLYNNRIAIGGFQSASYWTSTDKGPNEAWRINFAVDSTFLGAGKYNAHNVRCIRK